MAIDHLIDEFRAAATLSETVEEQTQIGNMAAKLVTVTEQIRFHSRPNWNRSKADEDLEVAPAAARAARKAAKETN